MSALASLLGQVLFAQAPPPGAPPAWLLWLFTWGEPSVTSSGWQGGLITWCKVLGLFCVLGWVGSWLIASFKDRTTLAGNRGLRVFLDMVALGGLILCMMAALSSVLVAAGRLPQSMIQLPTLLAVAGGLAILVWVEVRLWWILGRKGTGLDRALLVGMHLAILAGFGVAFLLSKSAGAVATPETIFMQGGRLGATYMGLLVLARIAWLIIPEILSIRASRMYAIAWHSWTEAFRRMWAPWVVIVVFGVILAFTSWFLQPARPAELSRLYIGTLLLLCSLLLTLTVVILAPISIPNDIRQQTIMTIVSKPVRRLEMIWGRMLGYMALVTVLLMLFGGISLLYFERQVGAASREAMQAAEQAEKEGKTEFANQFRDQAVQLRSRMSARVPVTGSLIFFDSRNNQRRKGIDVGMELPTRSFVEGATQARAVWRFGDGIPDPSNPRVILDRRVPLDQLLVPGTIEAVENQMYEAQDEMAFAQQQRQSPQLKTDESKDLTQRIRDSEARFKSLQSQRDELLAREKTILEKGTDEAKAEAAALHTPPIPIEMSFTVYRTTKGVVGEPVYASLVATNPRPGMAPHRDVFPVREYYTNKRLLPASLLAGSRGGLTIELRCLSPNQYIGMAEGDLYVLASEGRFWANYLRGLAGVWLQAMVLTAVGVFAGTFLSWPVALLLTIFVFVAGNAGFTTLQQMALSQELVGGGPFESLIRTLTHENLMSDLEATPPVVLAKTLDSIITPVLSRLVYLVPNLTALDVSNTVSSGFAVTWSSLIRLILMALAYAIPFSIAGYFILKNREVAA